MIDHRQTKCFPLFLPMLLSPLTGSAGTKTSSRFERTWILHSGNNTLRDVANLSFFSESLVKMIILSTFKLLSATGHVAFSDRTQCSKILFLLHRSGGELLNKLLQRQLRRQDLTACASRKKPATSTLGLFGQQHVKFWPSFAEIRDIHTCYSLSSDK